MRNIDGNNVNDFDFFISIENKSVVKSSRNGFKSKSRLIAMSRVMSKSRLKGQ